MDLARVGAVARMAELLRELRALQRAFPGAHADAVRLAGPEEPTHNPVCLACGDFWPCPTSTRRNLSADERERHTP